MHCSSVARAQGVASASIAALAPAGTYEYAPRANGSASRDGAPVQPCAPGQRAEIQSRAPANPWPWQPDRLPPSSPSGPGRSAGPAGDQSRLKMILGPPRRKGLLARMNEAEIGEFVAGRGGRRTHHPSGPRRTCPPTRPRVPPASGLQADKTRLLFNSLCGAPHVRAPHPGNKPGSSTA